MEYNQSDMDDRISALHDSLLCYILSFLPTKQCVATSVLSKRWKPLWRFVPTLDFDATGLPENEYRRFILWVDSVILSRDPNQPIKKFCFKSSFELDDVTNDYNLYQWFCTVLQRGVEYVYLELLNHYMLYDVFPYAVFSCRTLVVLNLKIILLRAELSVDLPSLKTLHLDLAEFTEQADLSVLLAGCPILEDLVLKNLYCESRSSKFTILPKLVRAYMNNGDVPLEVVSNVQFLSINMGSKALEISKACYKDLIFPNLIHIEFDTNHYPKGDLLEVIGMLYHCPNVQYLVVHDQDYGFYKGTTERCYEDRPYPPYCVSNHLKTCILNNYVGSVLQFNFTKYVMQNARFLWDMIIHSVTNGMKGEHQMLKELSLCTRLSSSCKLIFDYTCLEELSD